MRKLLIASLLFLNFSCSIFEDSFNISGFNPISNFDSQKSPLTLSLDFSDAYENGFVVPSINQSNDGKFHFQFEITNNSKMPKKFYYKIYYQNSSYKFDESHPFSHENFYGSWEDPSITFKETELIPSNGSSYLIQDSFRIVGNPRNEQQFYGSKKIGPVSDKEIKNKINAIKNNPDWLSAVTEKALANNIELETQIYKDAVYTAKQDRNFGGDINNRWKRNVRVGNYEFLLVVFADENELNKVVPNYIQNISLKNKESNYTNPFSFFSKDIGAEYSTILSKNSLKLKAQPSFKNGVFINKESFFEPKYDTTHYSTKCNENQLLLKNAHFEQFISSFNPHFTFNNIPVTADVTGNKYTRNDYYNSLKKEQKQIKTPIEVSHCPCKTVIPDSANNKVTLLNPAVKDTNYKKENVGIITRHGLTYGKYSVKAKLPQLLNKDLLWNGLTNAIWLIYQNGEWNQRRPCSTKNGFVPKTYDGNGAINYQRETNYSEIDIEIVKSARYWPVSSYGGDASKKPNEPLSDSNKVMVTFTNWDLACDDAQKLSHGVFKVPYQNNSFELHRWDTWYQAVTGKYGALNDELFENDYYWFQIEWKPEEIIWRIGPEKNQLTTIGYVNSDYSSIPNNQMLLVVTQEWHLKNWWPEAPFNQNYIPFPAEDIKGEVLEVFVE